MKVSEIKQLIFSKNLRSSIVSWGFFIGILIIINVVGNIIYGTFSKKDVALNSQSQSQLSSCNVVGINLHGELYTYIPKLNDADPTTSYDIVASEDVMAYIQKANQDSSIKAIIIEVDSPGGSPVAGEEIANALKMTSKPTVAVIRQSGTSAAYWAISSANKIFASKNSDIGSIGVTASYVQDTNKNKKFIQISVGKYKDTGNPYKPITDEDKSIMMRDVKTIQQNFINDVAINRKLPISAVTKIADGSSVLGDKAKALGLIDEIGDLNTAQKYLSEKIGMEVKPCW